MYYIYIYFTLFNCCYTDLWLTNDTVSLRLLCARAPSRALLLPGATEAAFPLAIKRPTAGWWLD